MKKIILLSIAIVSSISFYAQILITDADLDVNSPMDCAVNSAFDANFFDSGNSTGNYGPNENDTLVICPDYAGGTSKLSLTFGSNSGLSFDVHASDTIYVYDGPSTASPLLGKHNSDTDPTGFTHISSFINNPTGCFTIRFVSDGSDEGSGWEANIMCSQELQPIEAHMEGFLAGSNNNALTPNDTGYIDICLGDTIIFKATSIFPYASEITGVGYSQDVNTNIIYTWETSSGVDTIGDRLIFVAASRNGFLIRLTTTDSRGQQEVIQAKVRVSSVPGFSGVLITDDDICVGDSTVVIGGITASDTSGVNPNSSNFQAGGVFSEVTYLPDGSDTTYSTQITIAGYDPGSTITQASDIQELYAIIEHSWLGDLEMSLTCPNGTETTIFNSSIDPQGMIPGGFGGGDTFLGDPIDDVTITEGIGWPYRWSTANATLGDFAAEYTTNTIIAPTENSASMDTNGIYEPEQPFDNFIGCPVNGDWTIIIKDNATSDNGYIFEWGIEFDAVFKITDESYAPQIVSSQWLSSSTFFPEDTFIVVSSNSPGLKDYTFQVTDNFGCDYDTTVFVNFVPLPEISVTQNGNICDGSYQVTGTTAFSGGSWEFTSGPGNVVFSDANSDNPTITFDTRGSYTLTYTDNRCEVDTSMTIYYADSIAPFSLTDAQFCFGDEAILDATSQVAEAAYFWSNGETSPAITVTDSGDYFVTVTSLCNSPSDTATIITDNCNIIYSNVITPNGDGLNDFLIFGDLQNHPGSVLKVYNRWGNAVYESSDYQNDWSPTDLPAGTYYYILNPGGVLNADTENKVFTILK